MQDTFGRTIRYLRLSVTDLCNLRCRYCMPADGVCKKPHEQMMTEDEMITAVETAASLGVEKLRITGGEPLVKRNILSICHRASQVEGIREVCLTTNGTLLPEYAKALHEAGVCRINISLDTLDSQKYRHITRTGALDDALRGLHAALDAGFTQVKINAVLIGGFNDDEIPALAKLTEQYPVDVRFIELMPMRAAQEFGASAYLPASAVLDALGELQLQSRDGGVAERYTLPNAKGSVGLIRPVSAHFCASCNRIRVTADGRIKPCLHAAEEFNIRGLDREQMREVFIKAILAKPREHKTLSPCSFSDAGRNMNQIGG